jgi:hypothetical protein
MNLPSGLLDLLVMGRLFSQINTGEAAATVRKSCTETLNSIDKDEHHLLGKLLAFYLDEKALQADWFEQGYWTQPLSRERYPEVNAVTEVFDERITGMDQVEMLVLRFCILQGFKGPFKNIQNVIFFRDEQAQRELLGIFDELTGKLALSNLDTSFFITH